MQSKYKEKYVQINNKYSNEISELHLMIENLQKVIVEINQEKLEYHDLIQENALKEEFLSTRISYLETREVSLQVQMSKLTEESDRKSFIIERQKEENQQLQKKIQEIYANPIVKELPVEMDVQIETEDKVIQTDEIDLFENLHVIEVPIILAGVRKLSDDNLKLIDQDEIMFEKLEGSVDRS